MQNDHLPSRSVLSKVNEVALYASLILVPLLFLPFVQNVFDTPKYVFILVLTCVAAISWAIYSFSKKELSFLSHPFLLAMALMIVSILISAFFGATAFSEAFSGLYGALFLLSWFGLFAPTVIKKIDPITFIEVSLAIAIILTIISVLQLFGVGPSLLLNSFLTLKMPEKFQFSLAGSPLVTLTFLIPVLTAAVTEIITSKQWQQKIFQIVGSVILTAGILLHVFMMFPGKPDSPVLLPIQANWIIGVEMLKSVRTALTGFGPQGFGEAFTMFRPVDLNTTPFWNVIFQVGSNAPLSHLVSLGLIGVVAWIVLFIQVIRTLRKSDRTSLPLGVLVLTTLIVQLFLPLNIVILALQSVALVAWIVSLRMQQHSSIGEMILNFASLHLRRHDHQEGRSFPITTYLIGVLVCLACLLFLFKAVTNTTSEYLFIESIKAFNANEANKVYVTQQQVLRFSPYRDEYHRAYAQTNFALANAISAKEEITDEDRANVARLMEQAIREARVAAQLNPRRTQNWRTLAELYRSLLGSVEKADQFTVAAYAKAIETSPTDPTLRVDLGGIFMSAKQYDRAIEFFKQGAQLKPDYANAYYNWGKALEELKNFEGAVVAYKQTLQLLPADSDNYTQVKKDLDAAQEKLTAMQAAQPKTDTTKKPASASPTPTPAGRSQEEVIVPEQPEKVEAPVTSPEPDKVLEEQPALQPPAASPSATVTP